jgi:hypothetical protein
MVTVICNFWGSSNTLTDATKVKPQSINCVHFVYGDNAMQERMAEGHNAGIHEGTYGLHKYVNLQVLVLSQEENYSEALVNDDF